MPEAGATTKLWAGHEQVSLKPMHKLYVRTVNLTFDVATWLLHRTLCLVLMIIAPNNFYIQPCRMKLWAEHNSGMHNLKWWLWPWPLTYRHGSYRRYIVLTWWSLAPNNFQISICTMKLWLDTILEHTNEQTKHTDRVKSVCLSPFYGGGIKILSRTARLRCLNLICSIG